MNTEYKYKKETKDIGLAYALFSVGATHYDTDKSEPSRMIFYFGSNELDLSQVELEWSNATLLVNAVKMFDAMRRIKAVVHSR